MASITNVHLEIARDGSFADARVTYTLSGGRQASKLRPTYRETVELIGDDQRPGEDGLDDLIPGGLVYSGNVRFASTAALQRSRALRLPIDSLNEDSSADPRTALLAGDEIRARVTLTRIPPKPIRASSNIVLLGSPLLVVPND